MTLRCRDVEIDGVFYAKAKEMGIDITEVMFSGDKSVLWEVQWHTCGVE